jgi:hypothetical protein
MVHRGFSEGVRGSLILVAWLILGGCSGSSKVPATPKCFLASDCQNLLQCVQGYCVKACAQSRDCPNGERCITAAEGNTCQPLETAICQYNSQCTKPLVCAFDQKCRDQCQQNIDCPTGQMCTSITHLCADPTIDKNYNPVTNEFVATNDGGLASGGAGGGTGGVGGAVTGTGGAGAGGGSGASDAGVDAAVPNPGDDSGAGGGSSGGGDAGVDAPVTNPGDAAAGSGGSTTKPDGATSSGGAISLGGTTGSGGATGSGGRDAGTAGATGNTCATGQTPSNFGLVATGDSDPNYTSGVGVLTATEFLVFNAYYGPASTDGGTGANVNRIDVQHFDPITRASKTKSTPLLIGAGDSGIYINGAALAPTGEIAIIYSAYSGGWGVYLAFLDKNLGLTLTTLFVAVGSDLHQDQSYVQWLNGQFVASAIVYTGNSTMKLGKFGADGSNPQLTRVIPTDDPSGYVTPYNPAEGQVAFSGGTFAIAYFSLLGQLPHLTFVDASDPFSAEVASPVTLPSADQSGSYGFFAVAGTSQGFVTVYNGTSSLNAASLLATFVSNSASGDAGVPVGATHSFLGGPGYVGFWSADGRSDGTGAGFAVLYPDGSVSFLYFNADGSTHSSPQIAMEQPNLASLGDEVKLTNFGGTFAVSLYSSAEHLTRMVASICQ